MLSFFIIWAVDGDLMFLTQDVPFYTQEEIEEYKREQEEHEHMHGHDHHHEYDIEFE